MIVEDSDGGRTIGGPAWKGGGKGIRKDEKKPEKFLTQEKKSEREKQEESFHWKEILADSFFLFSFPRRLFREKFTDNFYSQ